METRLIIALQISTGGEYVLLNGNTKYIICLICIIGAIQKNPTVNNTDDVTTARLFMRWAV